MRTIRSAFLIAMVSLGAVSCITAAPAPTYEYTLAKAAYDSAVANEAAKYSPQIFYRAEKSFKKAETLFKERYYDAARSEFQGAQKLAERAELAARLKQFNSGGTGE